jgi:aminoglycoside 3-N-acetyltransferase
MLQPTRPPFRWSARWGGSVVRLAVPARALGGAHTHRSLVRDLEALGVAVGRVLLVHASMRALGPIEGGASTLAAALRDVLGARGTLVAPAHTANNSDTSRTHLAAIAGMTAKQVNEFRLAMPPFDPISTPSAGMGQLAELIRTTPGAVRSLHPQTSFAAVGPMAQQLMDGHAADCHLGEASPLARLYEVSADVLLLGMGYRAFTAFHLAEYRYTPRPPTRTYRCVVASSGRRKWWEYRDVSLDDSDFEDIGVRLDDTKTVSWGRVGEASCRLIPLAPAVDFAIRWMRGHRVSPTDPSSLEISPLGLTYDPRLRIPKTEGATSCQPTCRRQPTGGRTSSSATNVLPHGDQAIHRTRTTGYSVSSRT